MTLATLSSETSQVVDTPAPPAKTVAYEDFLAWALKEGVHAEWVKGEVFVYMSASPLHQKVVQFLDALLSMFVRLLGLGDIYLGPMQMRLEEVGREPDVLFVASANLNRVANNRLNGPADLVIEVVSDESVVRDRDDKYFEYEAASIGEYWIIDPRPHRQIVYFYQLDKRGKYQPIAPDENGVYHSRALPGLWVKTSWLVGPELPNPLLKLIEVLGPVQYAELLAQAQAHEQAAGQ